jgi:hypothetical protein
VKDLVQEKGAQISKIDYLKTNEMEERGKSRGKALSNLFYNTSTAFIQNI